jgi:hypothetical protein
MVPTSQKTRCVSITTTNRLTLFRETVAVYCENHTEHTNVQCVAEYRVFVFNSNADGTCSYRCALQG